MTSTETVLITGADGYVGSNVAARLLATTGARLVLAVRATDQDGLAAKRDLLTGALGPLSPRRVELAPVDLTTEFPFADVDPGPVTRVLHSAAVTRFNVARDLADDVNVRGARHVLDFARRCPDLQRMVALSSVYSAGRHTGLVEEKPHADIGFVNHYEWSKWASEDLFLEAEAEGLPLVTARLGTLLADNDQGEVSRQNAFHNTFRLIFHGLLSVLPGEKETPVYLLTADLAARALSHLLLTDDGVDGIYHVCPEQHDTPTLGQLVDVMLTVFEESPAYRARGLMRPLLCDRQAFAGLVAASETLGAGPMRQAVQSVAPFAEQLFLPKDVCNARLRQVFPDYTTPTPADLLRATAEWLVATRWGRTPGATNATEPTSEVA
jgi:nucleoside-diphosphate-sugar epimerase